VFAAVDNAVENRAHNGEYFMIATRGEQV